MIIKTEYIVSNYVRKSKLGKEHTYTRQKRIITFRCDSCGCTFNRERGKMDPKRLNNNVYHVCHSCDSKRFAQQKGVENKNIWDLPVSSLKTIDKLN
jgi:hypothetical protein